MPWSSRSRRFGNLLGLGFCLVASFADFSVTLADHAPPGASGRVQLTYLMQNTGPGSRVVIETTNGDVTTNPDTGGAAGAAGSGDSGGVTGAGGAPSSGRAGANAGGSANGDAAGTSTAVAGSGGNASAATASRRDSSCACQLPGRASPRSAAGYLLALLLGVSRRSRASRRLPRARARRCRA